MVPDAPSRLSEDSKLPRKDDIMAAGTHSDADTLRNNSIGADEKAPPPTDPTATAPQDASTSASDRDDAAAAKPANPTVSDDAKASSPPAAADGAAAKNSSNDDQVAPEATRTALQTTLIISALSSALFLAALDMTIISTAVPIISAHFHSNLGYTWIGSAYMLACAAFMPLWGKLSDIWGRKPLLLVAVSIFWLGSLLCGVSVSIGMLIAGRAVQGMGGGGIMILVNICISDLFSMRQRGVYFGVMGMVWAAASAVGPVLGGVFTQKVTWRWCFYVNLPISGASLLVLLLVLKLHNPRTPMRQGLAAIDWIGSVTIIGGTLMLLLGLEFGGVTYPWASAAVICLIIFGVVAIALFCANEALLARYPVVPLRLFRDRSNIAAFLVVFCHGYVFISGGYWLPLYFQGVLGVGSLLSGVYLLPYVLGLSLVSAATGVIIKKTGQYRPNIIFGMAVMTLGFGLFIDLEPRVQWAKLIIFMIIAGVGVGPNFQSPLIALQTTVEPRDIASATATFGFIRQLATAISVVIGSVVFNNEMSKQHSALQRELGPDLANMLTGGNAAASVTLVGQLPGRDGEIARAAYWQSLRSMYIMYTAFAAAGLLASFFVRSRKLSKEHTEHKTGLKTLRSREGRKETVPDEEKAVRA